MSVSHHLAIEAVAVSSVPASSRTMQESMKTRPTCARVFASASRKRVFCISRSALPNAWRSRA